jgi:hypothetical protein
MATSENTSILSLDQEAFMGALDELGIKGNQRDFLIREKRKHDSLFGGLMDAEAAPQGQRRATILPMTYPQNMTGWDALMSGQASLAMPGLLAGAISGTAKAIDLPRAAYEGQIPETDLINEALGVGGMLSLGGAGAAGRGIFDYDPTMMRASPGPKINKEYLDPIGYQGTKMRDYLSNTQLDLVDTGANLPRTPTTWESMVDRLIMPFYGDRSGGGGLLSGIDDTKFEQPVYTEGGVDFMRGPAAQKDRAIWASNKNIITRIANEADAARKLNDEGDIYGITGTMAPDANDFATFTGATMAEMVRNAPIKAADASKFDEMMLAIDPEFVGIKSPLLRQWAETTSSPNRKSFIRLMDSAPMQAAGFPSPGQARYGVTDATQRDMLAGMFGLGVGKLDEVSPVLPNTPIGNASAASVPHSTYNTQITGDYVGSLPPVPQGLLFTEIYDAMKGKTTKSGQPLNEAHKTHAIKTIMPVVRMTEPKIQGILDYFSRTGR